MKIRTGFVSNSSSTSYVICNLNLIDVGDIKIENKYGPIENRRIPPKHPIKIKECIYKIIYLLNKNCVLSSEDLETECDQEAFSLLIEYICEHKDKHLVTSFETGSDNPDRIINVNKDVFKEENNEN